MSLRLRLFLGFSLILIAGTAAAHAQFAIYGMGSGGFLGSLPPQNGGFSAYGGTFGVYDDFKHFGPLHLGADGRYFQYTSSNGNSSGNKLRGGLIGPRLALALPALPFRPYVQAETGDIATNYGTQPNQPNSFTYQIQGGLDFTIFPHLDLRGEYGAGQIPAYGSGQKQTVQEASVGLVVQFF